MRIIIKTSKWAIWSRRLGGFAVPLLVVPVIMHREAMLGTNDFEALLALGTAIAALALLFGLIAIVTLWFSGDRGWGRAFAGTILGALCLAPAAYAAYEYTRYPVVLEMSTDVVDRPELVAAIPEDRTDRATLEAAQIAFPNARTRDYQIAAPVLFGLVRDLVTAQGWETILTRVPADAASTGQINARVKTLFGWTDEVAIRLDGDLDGVTVAMRSASLTNIHHDLGGNGRRVEAFLVALDNAVTAYLRDMPPPDEDAEPVPDGPPIPLQRPDNAG